MLTELNALADLRQRAQNAQSQARVAADPTTKALWEALAAECAAKLAALEAVPPQPHIPAPENPSTVDK